MTHTGSFTPVATEEGGTKKTNKRCVIVVVAVVAILLVLLVAAALVYHLCSPQPDLLVQPADNIVFNSNDQDSQVIKDMELFIREYDEKIDTHGMSMVDCSEDHPRPHNHTCRFSTTWLADTCKINERFGFLRARPCLILSPNLVADWTPEVYEDLVELPEAMPEELKSHIQMKTAANSGRVPAMLWVSCSVEMEGLNITKPGISFMYTPWHGFPEYYFPYMEDMQVYISPLMGLQLSNIGNETQTIVCRTWAKNVVPDENPLTITIRMEDD